MRASGTHHVVRERATSPTSGADVSSTDHQLFGWWGEGQVGQNALVSENSLKEWWTYRRYRRLTDDEWRQTLLDSVSGSSKLPMPGFPPEQFQRSYVGQAGTDTIEEG